MKRWAIVVGMMLCLKTVPAFQMDDARTDLLRILDLQQAAWNRQDIEGFMAYYWKSDRFTFQSGANRLQGWSALLERYKTSYSGKNWGELNFTDLEVNVLGAGCAYVIGRYNLALKDTRREGLFTIIFKRFPEGWRIIHDQSS
ncbi:MAG TPA: nuclear transport factor 2 family protein [Candidatus Desulfaltia sp.]|nr:nuclear transport factor 2 family protein [Candidatus Desulfaltia sp.]